MLNCYAVDHGLENTEFYVDDGYSGTSFQRPGFQRMLADVETGKIGTIITKDLSRLGRNYLEAGRYIEMVFPEYNVRYIAINDQVDTDNAESNGLMPFRNVFNEWYARDTSKKIRAVVQNKYARGERYCANAPYGYNFDKEQKKLVVNPDTAPIVKQIYTWCMEGMGPTKIARLLTEKGVLTPKGYEYKSKNILSRHPTKTWNIEVIIQILGYREYIGDTVLGKTRSKSYKDKKTIDLPPEEWKIFKGTHEPIIDRDTWEAVQRIREGRRRYCKTGEKDKYAGLVFCADCGKVMYNHRAKCTTYTQEAYACGNYRRVVNACTAHFIRTVVLDELVLASVRNLLSLANGHENMFREYVQQCGEREQQEALKAQRKEMDKAQHRIKELDILFQKLFEGNATGRISDERYDTLSTGYEEEQRELKVRLEALTTAIQAADDKSRNADRFLRVARKYEDLRELTPAILRELIEKIVVFEREKINGKKGRQKIQIYYNFIGSIDLPTNNETAESA